MSNNEYTLIFNGRCIVNINCSLSNYKWKHYDNTFTRRFDTLRDFEHELEHIRNVFTEKYPDSSCVVTLTINGVPQRFVTDLNENVLKK